MKVVTANGKKKLVMSKREWKQIGLQRGWIPKKRLFASETKREVLGTFPYVHAVN